MCSPMRRVGLAAAAMFSLMANSHAAGLSGSWLYTTKTRPQDFFSLELLVNGNAVCGRANATSDGTNKVDGSWVVGTVTGRGAEVVYESGFNEPGSRGAAVITVRQREVRWRVVIDPALMLLKIANAPSYGNDGSY